MASPTTASTTMRIMAMIKAEPLWRLRIEGPLEDERVFRIHVRGRDRDGRRVAAEPARDNGGEVVPVLDGGGVRVAGEVRLAQVLEQGTHSHPDSDAADVGWMKGEARGGRSVLVLGWSGVV